MLIVDIAFRLGILGKKTLCENVDDDCTDVLMVPNSVLWYLLCMMLPLSFV